MFHIFILLNTALQRMQRWIMQFFSFYMLSTKLIEQPGRQIIYKNGNVSRGSTVQLLESERKICAKLLLKFLLPLSELDNSVLYDDTEYDVIAG